MLRIRWKVVSIILALAFLGGACGGNGGDSEQDGMVELCVVEYDHWTRDEPPDLSMENLEGIYDLHSFDIDVWIDGVYLGMPISSGDFDSFSGTLELGDGTIIESITVEDETAGFTGTYSVSSSSAYWGTLHVNLISESYDLTCAISTVMICDPECQDVVLMTLQNEQECILVPESELEEAAVEDPASVLQLQRR